MLQLAAHLTIIEQYKSKQETCNTVLSDDDDVCVCVVEYVIRYRADDRIGEFRFAMFTDDGEIHAATLHETLQYPARIAEVAHLTATTLEKRTSRRR